MSNELLAIAVCAHPEITIETSTAASWDYTVYCKTCHKKIIIPATTLTRNEQSLVGITAEVFGEEVGQRIARYT